MAVVHALLQFVGGRIRDALFVQSLCDADTPRGDENIAKTTSVPSISGAAVHHRVAR